jgi:hypothetical protein
VDLGNRARRRRAIETVTFGRPATTWTTGAGVIIALAGGCHPPMLVGKSGFKLKTKTIS